MTLHVRPGPIFVSIASRLRRSLRRAGAQPRTDLTALLGRRPVDLHTPELQRFLAGKTILVTGAGGSIGSEICRQSMRFCPAKLILLDRAEHALFEIDRELRHRWIAADPLPIVADICDAPRIAQIFDQNRPQVVFHAAAHKHVPMMEHNPGEAIKNNVLGTKIVADAALRFDAAAFVMVSTDKAVNPTSVMGATKRAAELYVQSLNKGQGAKGKGRENANSISLAPRPSPLIPRFVAVRFGNVLGSSGSVVPIFERQIDAGGPVTVTHPEMKRYFMTIPEASQLVMQAGAIGQGGEIFVLDMGEPMRIYDLACELIRRRGLRLGRDIHVEFTGIRPGEKLYEELACDDEQTAPTSHEKIRVWQLARASGSQIRRMMETLDSVSQRPPEEIRAALRKCVPEYEPGKVDDAPAAQSSLQLRLPDVRAAKAA